MDVSIIIVSWRVKSQLHACLTSIYSKINNNTFEVFVMDNDSEDGTVEMIKSNFPKVYLIPNSSNLGFAAACNQGIKKSSGEFILVLNPDTQILSQTVEKSVDFMRAQKKCGILGCQLLYPDGSIQPSVRRFPDLFSHITLLLKLHQIFRNLVPYKKYIMSDFDYNNLAPVDQVMGAFFMIKRELLKKIGLFDTHFFIWYEEVDLCLRAKIAGWLTYYYPEAQAIHARAQSFKQKNALSKQIIFNRSMLYYFFKHKNIFEYLALLIIYPISILLALIVQIFKLKNKSS
ncbi:MAG: glycosyltransferase family 2 protein [Patescibacteria group bacterium]|jgi:hypothetical protein